MEKFTVAQVGKRARENKEGTLEVTICPSKVNPLSMFATQIQIDTDLNVLSNGEKEPLDKFLNSYSYYNCTADLGKTIHYYIK